MSGSLETLSARCDLLTVENREKQHQITRLAQLLAENLNILDSFQKEAKDTLRHFSCERKVNGKFNAKQLEIR